MPIYAFKCPSCAHEETRDMPIRVYRDLPAQQCPECDSKLLRDYTGVHAAVVGTRKPKSSDMYGGGA